MTRLTASVAVENTAYSFDKLFDYLIPDELAEKVKPGCRVLVSFGQGSKKRQGFVFSVSDYPEDTKPKLKKNVRALFFPFLSIPEQKEPDLKKYQKSSTKLRFCRMK